MRRVKSCRTAQVLVALLVLAAAPVAHAASNDLRPLPSIAPLPAVVSGRFRPKEVVVLLRPGATVGTAQALAQAFGLQLEVFLPSRLLQSPFVRFHIPDARTESAVAAALRADPRVRASQRNFIYDPTKEIVLRKAALPQYALHVIGIDALRSEARGGHRPIIAIVDTGIDETHPELLSSVSDHFDAVGDGQWDTGAHGTAIAGIIGAHGLLRGIAPEAIVLSVRAFVTRTGVTSEGTSEALIRSLDWAVEQHADVINMSLIGPEDPFVDAAVLEAIALGVNIVAAAGNDGPQAPPGYPAAVKGVIAVTATDQSDALFAGANHGAYITVSAPGVDILSASPGGGYDVISGTSQAAAHVTGVIALLRSIRPDLSPAAALSLLQDSAKDLGAPGIDDSFGAGRINAAAAVQELSRGQQAQH
jgi:subtilisin family serine protease